MRLMLERETILLHKDSLKNMIDSPYSLEECFYLLSKHEGKGMSILFPEEVKNNLIVHGLLTEDGLLSTKGRSIIQAFLDLPPVTNGDLELESDFETFWKLFPSTDKIHLFPATRALKDNKARCKSEFTAIVNQGYSAKDIISGLQNQLDSIKLQSLNENRLTYMKNSLRWLKDKEFLAWIEAKLNDDNIKFDMDVF